MQPLHVHHDKCKRFYDPEVSRSKVKVVSASCCTHWPILTHRLHDAMILMAFFVLTLLTLVFTFKEH